VNIPGEVYIIVAGLAIAALGAATGMPLRPGTKRALGWVAAVLGGLLMILGLMVAVST
jgi:hypothetical protein